MRRAFANVVTEAARADDKIIFLTGDLGFGLFEDFAKEFPDRYINVGVAEAQLVSCAAGLALEGWRPIVYSIASFMTGRAFEQIRVDIGYNYLPVLVVGAGGGYTYANSGVTHHAKEDLALMRLIPGMTITCPGGPNEVTALMPQLLGLPGPSYIRLGRFGEPPVLGGNLSKLGKANYILGGEIVSILSTGSSIHDAVAACEKLSSEGYKPSLYHFNTIRPLDMDRVAKIAALHAYILVVEDHGKTGGLYSEIKDNFNWHVDRLGPSDELILTHQTQEGLKQREGYDVDAIVRKVKELWDR